MVILVAALALFGCLQAPPPEASPTPTAIVEEGNVTYVTDGDTIKVNVSGTVFTVRYIGIDTPETKHPTQPVECYGPQADAFNRQLVLGKTVRLQKDVSQTDRYGRLLRYVYVENKMVNEVMVRQGYAVSMTYKPDIRYQERFKQAENQAKAENLGLWKACQQEKVSAEGET